MGTPPNEAQARRLKPQLDEAVADVAAAVAARAAPYVTAPVPLR